ncbi:hypothetical protein HFP57_07640 [Parasphingopyxis algicola]|uniref:hypothetical protein n=1 Tax=Parasphingopyxis algicola TaxID=2026624 RepID=UPI00159FEA8C|nr:hypothetical protein [Parasphingopyxis algicola]QLC24913.1 hypothetical protein HFP57_07640 [Parasphingopyxis algicola]
MATIAAQADAAQRRTIMTVAEQIAEQLDALERGLDPLGPPPRHAAMVYLRHRQMARREKAEAR